MLFFLLHFDVFFILLIVRRVGSWERIGLEV